MFHKYNFSVLSLLSVILLSPGLSHADSLAMNLASVDLEQGVLFSPHDSTTMAGNNWSYLSLNLNVALLTPILTRLQRQSSQTLKSRGDAHITVINPDEFNKSFQKNNQLKMADIDAFAMANGLQNLAFTPVCIGRVATMISGAKNSSAPPASPSQVYAETFYILVDAPAIADLRQKIADKFNLTLNPGFESHITVGFNVRDLQPTDNVVKSVSTCMSDDDVNNLKDIESFEQQNFAN